MVSDTGLNYEQICELRYDEFYRLASLVRAKRWTPKTRNKCEKYL